MTMCSFGSMKFVIYSYTFNVKHKHLTDLDKKLGLVFRAQTTPAISD